MVKAKKQSKRQTLSKKYSIQKKAREHRRKMRKEAKAKGGPARRKIRRDMGIPNSCPFKADIISTLMSRKQAREALVEKEREELRRQEELKFKGDAEDSVKHVEDRQNDEAALNKLVEAAAASTEIFEAGAPPGGSTLSDGPSDADLGFEPVLSSLTMLSSGQQHTVAALRHQQHQQLRSVLTAADVIVEVLDARLPLAYRCGGLERWVMGQGKKLVLILNKTDLVPAHALAAWLRHLQRSSTAPVLAFKCASSGSNAASRTIKGKGARWSNVDPLHATDKLKRSGSHALGVQSLMRLLSSIAHAAANPRGEKNAEETLPTGSDMLTDDIPKDESESFDSKNKSLAGQPRKQPQGKAFLTVGIVGFPNVGKSSVINALSRNGSAAAVASMPGSTKVSKYVRLDKNTVLLDSPGVLFSPPAAEKDMTHLCPHPLSLAGQHQVVIPASSTFLLQSLLPVAQIPNPEQVAAALIAISSKETLQQFYQIASFDSTDEALRSIAYRRGKLMKGGVADIGSASKMFLKDWADGRIPYYALPSGFRDEEIRIVNIMPEAETEVVAIQSELLEIQLATLGVQESELILQQHGGRDGKAEPTHEHMRLMFGHINSKKHPGPVVEPQIQEKMEHVSMRQKARKLEKKRRRDGASAMDEDVITET